MALLRLRKPPQNLFPTRSRKKETVFGITRNYNITEVQLNEYNPLLEKVGLRRRMILRIPVYPKHVVAPSSPKPVKKELTTAPYIVKPKETKWRIAYNFQITIPELEALNPSIRMGLKKVSRFLFPGWSQLQRAKQQILLGTAATIITLFSPKRVITGLKKENWCNKKSIGFIES